MSEWDQTERYRFEIGYDPQGFEWYVDSKGMTYRPKALKEKLEIEAESSIYLGKLQENRKVKVGKQQVNENSKVTVACEPQDVAAKQTAMFALIKKFKRN